MAINKEELQAIVKDLQSYVEALPEDSLQHSDKERKRAYETSLKLVRQLESPIEFVLKLWLQPLQSAAVRVAIQGGWLKLLGDGKPKSARELADANGAEEQLIIRIMRLLTAAGIVAEYGPSVYCETSISRMLTITPFENGCVHFTDNWFPVLTAAPDYFASNNFKIPTSLFDCPQTHAFGGKTMWQNFVDEPKRGEAFHSVMSVHRDGVTDWLQAYSFEERIIHGLSTEKDAVLMIDVGGGQGQELQKIKRKFGSATGRLILQDQADVIARTDPSWAENMEVTEHDIFKAQPVQGARSYYLRAILHDWPDKDCRVILRHLAAAMSPDYSRLLLNELVLPKTKAPLYAAYRDLSVMFMASGGQRTAQEWEHLLDSCGLRIEKIWNESGCETRSETIIEAVLKE